MLQYFLFITLVPNQKQKLQKYHIHMVKNPYLITFLNQTSINVAPIMDTKNLTYTLMTLPF
jgi:hypothetical protein